jgi:hypothetical protein
MAGWTRAHSNGEFLVFRQEGNEDVPILSGTAGDWERWVLLA